MYLDCYHYKQSTNKNNGVFTNDSSADLMVGCSGPLTPPTNTDDNVADTTIMPHPVAQQVMYYNCSCSSSSLFIQWKKTIDYRFIILKVLSVIKRWKPTRPSFVNN